MQTDGISIELETLSILSQYGTVSIPYGNKARYDCIWDINNHLIKVQIKTARSIDENKIEIPMANRANGGPRQKYTVDEADYILTCYHHQIYAISTSLQNHNSITLRFNYPANGIRNTIHLANDFLLEKVFDLKH